MQEDKLRAFSVEEVCERLGLHRTTVQKLLRKGRIKGFKVGRIWKVPAVALDRFLREEAGLGPDWEQGGPPAGEKPATPGFSAAFTKRFSSHSGDEE